MNRKALWLALGLLPLGPQAAEAHAMLQGVGDFYGGLLHPLVVPAEIFAIAAVGLLLGMSGLTACRWGVAAFAIGLAGGLILAEFAAIDWQSTRLLLGAASVAAVSVSAALRWPPIAATSLAMFGGISVGLDARPEATALPAYLTALAGTVIGGTAAVVVVAALVLGRDRDWQRIAARIAGSWITASAIMYFAWQAVVLPR